jgi:hypothetical protein
MRDTAARYTCDSRYELLLSLSLSQPRLDAMHSLIANQLRVGITTAYEAEEIKALNSGISVKFSLRFVSCGGSITN